MNSRIFDQVKIILEDRKETRNNDIILCWYLYERINKKWDGTNPMSVRDFFTKLYNKSLPSFSSITRARRAVQQHYPELRGDIYISRHKNQKKIINMVNHIPIQRQINREKEILNDNKN